MENSFEIIVILLIGLFSVIRFRQLGRFANKRAGKTSDKTDLRFMQLMFLVVGTVFIIMSSIKLFHIYF